MACYHPLKAYRTSTGVVFSELARHGDFLGELELPCGQCIGCRMRRASDWELRVMHEAQMWESNCFVTLTYAPGSLPPNASLEHHDFQLFMKRLRRHFKRPIRFYMCGEYGPLNLRPHFHACLFNVDFPDGVPAGKSAAGAVFFDSPLLSRLWGLGRASVQPLTKETASYCARYIMKKVLGKDSEKAYESVDADGVVVRRRPEYAAMSLKPGIGARWFDRFGRDVFPHDFVIADGVKRRPPKYYDKLFRKYSAPGSEDPIDQARYERGRATIKDSTPERLAVRETVHLARVSTLARSDLDGNQQGGFGP